MRRLLFVCLLLCSFGSSAGTLSLDIDLHPTNLGLKSLIAYTWTTDFLEYDPRNFHINQAISESLGFFSADTTALSYSHNLNVCITPDPPQCFTATGEVIVQYVVMTPDSFSKNSDPVCYQGPSPDRSTDPVNGPGSCNDPSCMGQWEPLVLDLNGDGVNTTGTDAMVWFDLDGDGIKDHLTWTNGGTVEGFLWVNLAGKNRVDNGSELFGIGTLLPDGTKARDGFEALAIYDRPAQGGNGDRIIDARDGVWNKLRVWIDANHDGVCDPGEVNPLHRYGVEGISLAAVRSNSTDPHGNGHFLTSRYWRRIGGRTAYFAIDGLTFRGD